MGGGGPQAHRSPLLNYQTKFCSHAQSTQNLCHNNPACHSRLLEIAVAELSNYVIKNFKMVVYNGTHLPAGLRC